MIKLIVTDLDNTLLNSQKEITDYTARVLASCQEKGIKLAFATARSERVLKQFQIKVKVDYLISNNGAVIYQKDNIFRSLNIPNETVNKLIKELQTHKEIERIWIDVGTHTYINVADGIPSHWGALNVVYKDLSNGVDEDSTKISVRSNNHELLVSIINKYPDLQLYANSGEEWYQINHVKATKANGVRLLCETLKITLDEVVAFGDDFNDIDMLQGCGMGIAVSNAAEKVKQIAQEICDTNDNDGVAKWLEKNLLKR